MKKQYLEAGRIVGTHGIKGMLRVQPWSDSGDFLTRFRAFFLDAAGQTAVTVQQVQPHGSVVLLKLEGIDSVEAAETLRGKKLYIDRADAGLPDGRYFVDDLIGCTVFDADSGEQLGRMAAVSQTGANDVWHVERGGREYLVPAIREVIVSVDIDAGRIVLRPLKGIFDDEN